MLRGAEDIGASSSFSIRTPEPRVLRISKPRTTTSVTPGVPMNTPNSREQLPSMTAPESPCRVRRLVMLTCSAWPPAWTRTALPGAAGLDAHRVACGRSVHGGLDRLARADGDGSGLVGLRGGEQGGEE